MRYGPNSDYNENIREEKYNAITEIRLRRVRWAMVMMNDLIGKIKDGTTVVGLMGLGYVGLPLAMAFSTKFRVVGYDIHEPTIERLKKGNSHIQDVSHEVLQKVVGKNFIPTTDPSELIHCDFIILCVPTPLTGERIPDLSYIISACNVLKQNLRRGQFIILESTTYPGTTEEVVIPILESGGLKAGSDFGVAYSPERIDPGNKKYDVAKVAKVVGGIDHKSTEIAAALYGSVIETIVKVTDTRTAESVKMVENIFRNVNIALANELALIFERMGINTWEVIDAAASKPYGYMAFYPGPGIGGHCIPLDPFYMSYKAKKYGFIPRFIETSGEINEFMKVHAINLAETGLKRAGKKLYGSTITIMGLAYKKNVNDPRETPAISIIEELVRSGTNVVVYDPHVPSVKTEGGLYHSSPDWRTALEKSDCVMFLVDHDCFKEVDLEAYTSVMASPVVVDCKNMYSERPGIIYLGIGKGN